MKKVARILGLCALVALATVSCKKDDNNAPQGGKSFRATINQPTDGAKTHIGEWEGQPNYLLWNDNDKIMVYTADGTSATFTTNDANALVAEFTGDIKEADKYVAFYPAANASEADGGFVTLTLPEQQTYFENNFANGAYPMAAYWTGNIGDDVDFQFHSPCAVVCLPLKGDVKVTSIDLTGKNPTDILAGTLKVDINNFDPANPSAGGYQPVLAKWTVSLSCGDGIQLDPDTPTNFYFVVAAPHTIFKKGLKFDVNYEGGNETLETTENNSLSAETILTMPEVKIEYAYPTVTTLDATNITLNSAVLNGEAVATEGTTLTECGFYYGTSEDQLNTKVQAASATSPFSCELTLTPGTYYFKAYAKNDNGIEGCGEVKSFIISESGLLSGTFTVASGKTVNFSKGNLQCERTNDGAIWSFATNQYDRIGNANANIGQVGVTIDLFGWGTSGYNTPAWTSSTNPSEYGPTSGDLTGNWDWGYNAITNGGNQENSGWRTLTNEEWAYLCPGASGPGNSPSYDNCRTTQTSGLVYNGPNLTTNAHWAMAVVCGVNGLIILPDVFTYPAGLKNAKGYEFMYADYIPGTYDMFNVYEEEQWAVLEQAGCVFLPAGGWREGTTIDNSTTGCNYWSATRGFNLQADNSGVGAYYQYVNPNANVSNILHAGFFVRLVKDCE